MVDPYGLIRYEGQDLTRLRYGRSGNLNSRNHIKDFARSAFMWIVVPHHFLESNLSKRANSPYPPLIWYSVEHYSLIRGGLASAL